MSFFQICPHKDEWELESGIGTELHHLVVGHILYVVQSLRKWYQTERAKTLNLMVAFTETELGLPRCSARRGDPFEHTPESLQATRPG